MKKQERPFSQKKQYRDLTQDQISDMTEEKARELFAKLRWGSATTMPCPSCGAVDQHYVRKTRNQYRCKRCFRDFSVTTGTPFQNRKLPFKKIIQLIYEFIASPKGCASNEYCSKLGIAPQTAFLNFHKVREALFEQRNVTPLSGLVQVDGGHFCGKPRRPRKRKQVTSEIVNNKLRNRKASMIPGGQTPMIEPWNLDKLKNRRIAVILHQAAEKGVRPSRSIVAVAMDEHAHSVIPIIKKYVSPGAQIWTDNGKGYSRLISHGYTHEAVTHSREYSRDDGVNNNQAESFLSRIRRAEYGIYHGMRHQYFAFYANEYVWRSEMKGKTLLEKFEDAMKKSLQSGTSKAWRRYAQGHRLESEYLE